MTIKEVASPLQCPAREYGSSFSRAVEMISPEQRRLLVSGTASIEESGKTVHIDEVEKQVSYTMEVVEAILVSRGMSFSDVTRGVVYFKQGPDTPAFENYCRQRGILDLPVLITNNMMCRDNLLFEIEVDAVSKR
jgi:enamine deaminase RidA (YjgF/YER057c/UK114 family)